MVKYVIFDIKTCTSCAEPGFVKWVFWGKDIHFQKGGLRTFSLHTPSHYWTPIVLYCRIFVDRVIQWYRSQFFVPGISCIGINILAPTPKCLHLHLFSSHVNIIYAVKVAEWLNVNLIKIRYRAAPSLLICRGVGAPR